jgi:hypothetical protein
MYDVMHRASLPRASIALFSAGRALARVPGHEREARDTLQRFLRESTTLTDDAQVRDWRSDAVEQLTELEARIEPDDVGEEHEQETHTSPPPSTGGDISPVGPVLLAVGGAAIVAGIVTGVVALSEGDQLRADCGGAVCPESERSRIADVNILSGATDALLFGGAAVAAVGLVLTLVLHDEAPDSAPQVALGCTPTTCAIFARGVFQ